MLLTGLSTEHSQTQLSVSAHLSPGNLLPKSAHKDTLSDLPQGNRHKSLFPPKRSFHIVGGGSNAGYLNELTAKATKKEIHAGPGEATAIGNITAQMLKAEEFKTIEEARTTIHESFGIKVYKA